MALVGAYVMAGELAEAGGDHLRAFAEYALVMSEYVRANQELGATTLEQIVPRTDTTPDFLECDLRRQFLHASNCLQLKDYSPPG